jgi:hypothetical protein
MGIDNLLIEIAAAGLISSTAVYFYAYKMHDSYKTLKDEMKKRGIKDEIGLVELVTRYQYPVIYEVRGTPNKSIYSENSYRALLSVPVDLAKLHMRLLHLIFKRLLGDKLIRFRVHLPSLSSDGNYKLDVGVHYEEGSVTRSINVPKEKISSLPEIVHFLQLKQFPIGIY